jgi:hypothetical protein
MVKAYMDLAVQKSPGGKHHGCGAKGQADLRHRAHNPVTFDQQIVNGLLEQAELGLVFQHAPDCCLVQNPVGLGAGGAHGRTLAGVEYSKLDAGFVRR